MIYTFLVLGMLFVVGCILTVKKAWPGAFIVWACLGLLAMYVGIYGGLPR